VNTANSPFNLEQFQRNMAAAVMQPLTPDEQMQSHNAAGRSMDEVAGEFVKPNRYLTAFERLEIYNRQYWFRLQGAFAEDFPGLQAVIGPDRFEALRDAYLQAHPSRSFTLRNLGSKLWAWLSTNPEWAGPRLDLALDVIRVEWACIEAFDNAELPPLSLQEASGIGAESQLALQPHVQLLALAYPADDLVLDLHQKQKRESSEVGTRPEDMDAAPVKPLRMRKRPTWLAIHRADYSLYYRRLTRHEYNTLAAIQRGDTLPHALEAGFADSKYTTARRIALVQTWFRSWAEMGWICRSSIEESSKG